MKIRQSAIYAIGAGLALLGGTSGFFAGSAARPQQEPPEQLAPVAAKSAETVEQAQSERERQLLQAGFPAQTPRPAQTPQPSASLPQPEEISAHTFRTSTRGGYTLSYENSNFVVRCAGRTTASIPAEKAPPESETSALAAGVRFDTLEEIERYLEAYES